MSVLTRPTDPDHAFRHDAFVHESQDEYVARSVAFLREGLAAGEGRSSATRATAWPSCVRRSGPTPSGWRFVTSDPSTRAPWYASRATTGPFSGSCRRRGPVRGSPSTNSVDARGLGGVGGVRGDDERLVFAPSGVGGVHLRRERPARPGVGVGRADPRRDADRRLARKRTIPGTTRARAEPHARAATPPADLRAYPGGGDDLDVFRVLLASELVAKGCPTPRCSTRWWQAPRSPRTR